MWDALRQSNGDLAKVFGELAVEAATDPMAYQASVTELAMVTSTEASLLNVAA